MYYASKLNKLRANVMNCDNLQSSLIKTKFKFYFTIYCHGVYL